MDGSRRQGFAALRTAVLQGAVVDDPDRDMGEVGVVVHVPPFCQAGRAHLDLFQHPGGQRQLDATQIQVCGRSDQGLFDSGNAPCGFPQAFSPS